MMKGHIKQENIEEVINNMNAEGLKAKHTAGYLVRLQNTSEQLKRQYVSKNAEYNYNIVQNKIKKI